MKCKSCGFEYSDSKNFCPMCGAQREENAGVINWNNREFPKPKAEEPVEEKNWSSLDVTEGYVAVPHFESEKKQDKFYTFQTKNEEFQKLLDIEFERLKEIQQEEQERSNINPAFASKFTQNFSNEDEEKSFIAPERAFPNRVHVKENATTNAGRELKEETAFGIPEESLPQRAFPGKADERTAIITESLSEDAFNKMLEADTEDSEKLPRPQLVSETAAPAAVKVKSSDIFDINVLEQTIQQIEEEEETAMKESEERRKKLEAMAAARDAYFQCLDEDYKKPQGIFARRQKQNAVSEIKVEHKESKEIAKPAIPKEVKAESQPIIKAEPASNLYQAEAEKPKENIFETVKHQESMPAAKVTVADDETSADIQWLYAYLDGSVDVHEKTEKFDKADFRAAQHKLEAQYFAEKHGYPLKDTVLESDVKAETYEEIIGGAKEITALEFNNIPAQEPEKTIQPAPIEKVPEIVPVAESEISKASAISDFTPIFVNDSDEKSSFNPTWVNKEKSTEELLAELFGEVTPKKTDDVETKIVPQEEPQETVTEIKEEIKDPQVESPLPVQNVYEAEKPEPKKPEPIKKIIPEKSEEDILFDKQYQELFGSFNKKENKEDEQFVAIDIAPAEIESEPEIEAIDSSDDIPVEVESSDINNEDEAIHSFEDLFEDTRSEEEKQGDTKPSFEFVLSGKDQESKTEEIEDYYYDSEYEYDDSEYSDNTDPEDEDDEDKDDFEYEDEDEEYDKHSKGGFLKFLAGFVVVIAVVKGGVFGMEKLMPNKPITKTVVNISTSIEATLGEWTTDAIEFVEGIFNK